MSRRWFGRIVLVAAAVVILSWPAGIGQADPIIRLNPAEEALKGDEGEFVPGEVIIKLKDEIPDKEEALTSITAQIGGEVIDSIDELGLYLIALPEQASSGERTAATITQLDKETCIEGACPNMLLHAMDGVTPNDPYFSQQWALTRIEADQGWEIEKGSPDVIVAVLDTGVDYNHPDLVGKVILGWDFWNLDNDPMDDNGHGTHVAGIAAANTDNGEGIAGTSWNAKILAVKVANSEGIGTTWHSALGIVYAAKHGARIINMSYGSSSWLTDLFGSAGDLPEYLACKYAVWKGCLPVAAAGNENCSRRVYPAALGSVIAVAATDKDDTRAIWTSYGNWVDISSPGTDILSTIPDNAYDSWSGTSMATPFVSGVASLIWSLDYRNDGDYDLSPEDVKAIIKDTADPLSAEGMGAGRLNAYKALAETQERLGIPPLTKSISVDDDFIDDPANHRWNTIQEGIDDANSGDTVIVHPGTYTENLNVNSSITVISESGANSTIVEAANSNRSVFWVTADHVDISGFTVRGALGSNAGIFLDCASCCDITENIGSKNAIGIWVKSSNANTLASNDVTLSESTGIVLSDCFGNTLVNNTVTSSNNGIGLSQCSNNSLIDNIVNLSEFHGVWLYKSSNNILTRNVSSNNYWCGIQVSSSNNNQIYLNNFTENSFTNVESHDSTNIWNSPEEVPYTYDGRTYANHLGNYWSDYAGVDANGDGIGDTAYSINSDKDSYPLSELCESYFLYPEATISYSPSNLGWATPEGSHSLPMSLNIWNSGGGTLDWSVTDNATWLSLSPASGSSTGEVDTVTVLPNSLGMSAGDYGATITISALAATNSPQTVGVDLHIYAPHNNPPNTASNPSPANHAPGVSINADLSWTGGDPDAADTVTYDVYFGTTTAPPFKETIGPYLATQSSIIYDPGTLSYNTKYYWKIVATDNHSASTTGPVWEFTTEVAVGQPDITVSPPSFDVTLSPDTVAEYTLNIANDGGADLTYDITHLETTAMTSAAQPERPTVPTPGTGEPGKPRELRASQPPCSRTAPTSGSETEISYDDGVAETSWSWYTGGAWAVRFTPLSYPVGLKTARVCLLEDWPDSDHEEFGVEVYDDDGTNGALGTLLGTVYATAKEWGWCHIDLSALGITVTEGDFYIAYVYLSDYPDCEAVCFDESDADGRSWCGYGTSWWQVEDDPDVGPGDWMIRCIVDESEGLPLA